MNRYRMFFVRTSTRPPNMHQKLAKHGRICKQNNQLPTKSHDVLEDNCFNSLCEGKPIAWPTLWLEKHNKNFPNILLPHVASNTGRTCL